MNEAKKKRIAKKIIEIEKNKPKNAEIKILELIEDLSVSEILELDEYIMDKLEKYLQK